MRTIARIETANGHSNSTAGNLASIRTALETAGIEFIETDDGGCGVIYRAPTR
jgi:hypothetical protein